MFFSRIDFSRDRSCPTSSARTPLEADKKEPWSTAGIRDKSAGLRLVAQVADNIRHRIDDLDIDIDTQKTQSSQTRSAAAAKGRGGLGGTGRSPLAPRWRRHVDVCGFFPRGRKVGFQEIALSMLAAARET